MFSGFRSRWTTPLRVNVFERFQHFDGDADGAVLRHAAFVEDCAQQRAVAPLHHHVDARPLLSAVDAHDHGMVELLADVRLALEAIEEDGVGFHVRVRNLQGDDAVVARIYGAKDRCHAAPRYRRFDAVGIDLRAGFDCVEDAHRAAFSMRAFLLLYRD